MKRHARRAATTLYRYDANPRCVRVHGSIICHKDLFGFRWISLAAVAVVVVVVVNVNRHVGQFKFCTSIRPIQQFKFSLR